MANSTGPPSGHLEKDPDASDEFATGGWLELTPVGDPIGDRTGRGSIQPEGRRRGPLADSSSVAFDGDRVVVALDLDVVGLDPQLIEQRRRVRLLDCLEFRPPLPVERRGQTEVVDLRTGFENARLEQRRLGIDFVGHRDVLERVLAEPRQHSPRQISFCQRRRSRYEIAPKPDETRRETENQRTRENAHGGRPRPGQHRPDQRAHTEGDQYVHDSAGRIDFRRYTRISKRTNDCHIVSLDLIARIGFPDPPRDGETTWADQTK
ncbi:hypothetical protein D8S78_11370 [Natrialba swarupiae]|nr:hypothetical protein [Natrialba swarupiae]